MFKRKKQKLKRVVCAGTFDHLHPGHIDFLKQAKALGDELLVIVARDENVERLKGLKPEHEDYRKVNMEETGIPDLVILGYLDKDPISILKELSPDVVALGYDQRVTEDDIKAVLPDCKVVRLNPFYPEKFKSSFYR
ncbi:MAG: FAD synthase [Nitrospirae bacterium]|nr:FAD synthase [Nitrospirota bacterium]